MINKLRLDFNSALTDIVNKNKSFDLGKLRIAYTGKNRNNSSISKEVFEKAIPTMFNVPIVANYMREQNEIGEHDVELIPQDGKMVMVNITEPVGVVPESASWNWEVITDNGEIHEYLCTDVLLWKRQEAYKKIKENGITRQSMEISVTDGDIVDGIFVVNAFEFTAFCLLGTAEPCFESAALFTFSSDEDKEKFNEDFSTLLSEYKQLFSKANTDVPSETNKKEVLENLNKKKLMELCTLYKVQEEDLGFDYSEMNDEELENKFKELYTINEDSEEVLDEESEEVETETVETEEDFTLNSQLRDALYEAVSEIDSLEDDYGEYPRYSFMDFDIEASEVYMCDRKDYSLQGCVYSMNGDVPVLNLETMKKKKYIIVDFEEPSGIEEFTFIPNRTEAFKAYLESELNKKDETFSELSEQFEELKAYKADKEANERLEAETALFESFEEELNNVEEFEALKENSKDYTLEELEKELFALVGQKKFSLSANAKNKVVVSNPNTEKENVANDRYGDYLK